MTVTAEEHSVFLKDVLLSGDVKGHCARTLMDGKCGDSAGQTAEILLFGAESNRGTLFFG